ncbi:MAG: putative toxin [Anaerolineae bacterium]
MRHLTDPLGQVVQSYRFSPFGVPLGVSGGEPYGYTGEHWDAATSLLYLRARWYDPTTGRFLTRDPFPGLATLPSTQHPYVYVGNNPVNLTDPSGEFAFVIPLLLGAAIGGGFAAYNYFQAQPCAAPPSLLSDPGFLRAVGIGMLTGAVGGLIGFGVGVVGAGAFGGGLAGALITGAVGGGLAGGAGEALTQLALYGQIRNPQLVGAAMLSGVVSGGVFGAVGYGIGQLVQPAAGEATSLDPNAIGRAGEEAAGITGPKTRIDSLAGTAKFRVPDQVDKAVGVVREVKNVARLSYTRQLRDYSLWAQREGYTFELIVRQTTRLSGPLQAAIERGEIIQRYLPW